MGFSLMTRVCNTFHCVFLVIVYPSYCDRNSTILVHVSRNNKPTKHGMYRPTKANGTIELLFNKLLNREKRQNET